MPMAVKWYGWKPDYPDHRDFTWQASAIDKLTLPKSVDSRPAMPPIWDQESLGSCTANSTGGQVWHLDKTAPYMPSRLFIYYNTRVLEGTVNQDSGASIRNSIKSVVKWGYAPEEEWAYNIRKFKQKPPATAYKSALKQQIKEYARVVQSAAQIRARLAEGFTINFGFSVYTSFESNAVQTTGIMTMPRRGERLLGGHAVLLVGYDDAKERYIVRNSWGTAWGDGGHFYMPYDYVHSPRLSADFWTITRVP